MMEYWSLVDSMGFCVIEYATILLSSHGCELFAVGLANFHTSI